MATAHSSTVKGEADIHSTWTCMRYWKVVGFPKRWVEGDRRFSFSSIWERDIHVRTQTPAAITIPTDISMDIAAPVSTGDLSDEIMIEKGFMLTAIVIFSDPVLISPTVFRFT